MSLKIAGLDNTMTRLQRNVLTVQMVSNVVYLQKLYVHLELCMIRILQSALSAQMYTSVFIHQVAPYNLRTVGAMAKTRRCQPSWIFS
jgi:hypothetical protein